MWVGAKAKGREGRSSKSNLLRRGKLVGTLVGLLRKKSLSNRVHKAWMNNAKSPKRGLIMSSLSLNYLCLTACSFGT